MINGFGIQVLITTHSHQQKLLQYINYGVLCTATNV